MDHIYQNITGWAAFTDLYAKAVRGVVSDAVFVEVGSWLGKSAAFMAVEIINSGKPIRFYCVDPWVDGGPDLKDTGHFKNLKEPIYTLFARNVLPCAAGIAAPLRKTSVEASRQFQPESVDFLMLDGDHSYEAVKADLDAWMPKMKTGSVISGDDYLWPGVKQAVTEHFGQWPVQTVIKNNNPNYLNSSSYWWVQL